MASEIKVDTISEKTSAGGVTIDGLLIKDGNISGDVALAGTTPTFTIGDAGAEDATLLFDGNAQDYYIALDDSADDLLIGLGSTVGTTPAIAIDENLKVNIPVTTASTSASTGSLTTGGGAGIGADLYVGDDAYLITDSAVLGFGADKDTLLTHTDGTGLTLNSTNKLCFNDASQFVQGSSATVLSIGATDEIDLTATTVDLNGTLNVSGVATFQATPVFPDGSLALADLDIDGGTDIGAALVDADEIIVDDGGGGTNRRCDMSRVATYVGASAGAFSLANLDIDGGTDIGAAIVDADLFIIDDGAGGTNRKVTASRLKTYAGGAALSNDANNRVVTADGSDGLNGEANLTFDGTTLVTAGQVSFPASQSASADANTLDDYEEGDWTPAGNNVSFASSDGIYTKIGDTVFAWGEAVWPSTSDTNGARMTGLPFTVNGDVPGFGGGFWGMGENDTHTGATEGQAYISFRNPQADDSGAGGNEKPNNVFSTDTMKVGVCYKV